MMGHGFIDRPIRSVAVPVASRGYPIVFHKVDLSPCPRCGALRWVTCSSWDADGDMRCGECNLHTTWQHVAEPFLVIGPL